MVIEELGEAAAEDVKLEITDYVVCDNCGILCKMDEISSHIAGHYNAEQSVSSLNNSEQILKDEDFLCGICEQMCRRSNMASHIEQHNREAGSIDLNTLFTINSDTAVIDTTQGSKNVMDVKVYACKSCPYRSYKRPRMKEHVDSCSSRHPKFGCKLCGMAFRAKRYLSAHLKIHEYRLPTSLKPDSFSCKYCPYTSLEAGLLLKHMETCGVAQHNHECDQCGQVFKDKMSLVDHLRMHGRNQNCIKCGFSTDQTELLVHHIASCPGKVAQIMCNICNHQFTSHKVYTTHMNRHRREVAASPKKDNQTKKKMNISGRQGRQPPETENTPGYICHRCSYTTMKRPRLMEHLNVCGVTEAKHQCYLCGKLFKCQKYLDQHVRAHKNGDYHACSKCGRNFIGIKRFEMHGKICKGIGTWYTCDICKKTCRTHRHFLAHKERHSIPPKPRRTPIYMGKRKKDQPTVEDHNNELIDAEVVTDAHELNEVKELTDVQEFTVVKEMGVPEGTEGSMAEETAQASYELIII